MHKNRKILCENSLYQKQENLLFKQSATKLICILQGGKADLYLLKKKQNFDQINIKN